MLTYNKLVPETLQTRRIAARKVHVEMSDARAPAHQRDGVVAATASAQCARAELPSSKSAPASVSTTAQHNPLSGGGLPASKARHGPEHRFYREGVKTAVTAVSDRATFAQGCPYKDVKGADRGFHWLFPN